MLLSRIAKSASSQLARQRERLPVQHFLLGLPRLRRKDQRRARLVDQHAVGLVDDRELQPAQQQPPAHPGAGQGLHLHRDCARFSAEHHAIAQVVEGDLLVAAVSDVAAVGRAARFRVHALLDAAHGEAERMVDGPHALRVALREVVVHRDDVHRAPGERRGCSGEGRGDRLALARLHLGQHAVEHRPAADELHVEMPLADRARCRLAHQREGLRRKIDAAEALAPQALAQLRRLSEQLLGRERL